MRRLFSFKWLLSFLLCLMLTVLVTWGFFNFQYRNPIHSQPILDCIAKAKKNEDTTDFFKLFCEGGMVARDGLDALKPYLLGEKDGISYYHITFSASPLGEHRGEIIIKTSSGIVIRADTIRETNIKP